MKIKPEIYARTLIEATDESNLKTVAKNFWYKLQKNGQYKDLSKIVDALDLEYAKSKDMLLAIVHSGENLSSEQLKSIEEKLTKLYSSSPSTSRGVEKSEIDSSPHDKSGSNNKFKGIILKNILKEGLSGIVVKIDDNEIDMSLEGKIGRLKQKLQSEC